MKLSILALVFAAVSPVFAFQPAHTTLNRVLSVRDARRGEPARPDTVCGFPIPKDAKSVDDVVGTKGSIGTKLRIAGELRKMGYKIPLVYKPPLSDEEKVAKAALRKNIELANLGVALFFLANVIESFLNAQYHMFPELGAEWNYSGNNDKVCAELKAKGKESPICSDFNLKKVTGKRLTPVPKGITVNGVTLD